MLDNVRGTHSCFICSYPMTWVTNIFGDMIVSYGTEVTADVIVSRGKDENNQVELSCQLQCPECGAINEFKHLHGL